MCLQQQCLQTLFYFYPMILFYTQGHRGFNHVFYKLILFYRVLTKFQDAFYRFKKLKLFLRDDWSKSGRLTGFLLEGKTKTA